MPIAVLLEAIASILLGSLGQVFLKLGAGNLNQVNTSPVSFLFAIATNWHLILGLTMYALSAIMWIHVLSTVNLSIAYPLVGLSFIFVVLISRIVLGEPVTLIQIAGCAVIISGIMLVLKGQVV